MKTQWALGAVTDRDACQSATAAQDPRDGSPERGVGGHTPQSVIEGSRVEKGHLRSGGTQSRLDGGGKGQGQVAG